MDRAHVDARSMAGRAKPIVEMLIPSTLDDTLAPQGQHVASLFCQHVAPELPNGVMGRSSRGGRRPDDRHGRPPMRRTSRLGARPADHVAARSGAHLRPRRRRHLPRALISGQLFTARPMLGHADYRGPVPGLYMCGSGTHPGGGVTGAPGHNAAREVLKDFKRRLASSRGRAAASREDGGRLGARGILRDASLRDAPQDEAAVTRYPPHTAAESAPAAFPDARGRSPARPNPGRSARCRGGSRACA